jgi:hypothetical protein
MLLKDFIKETLINITQGVEEANQTANRFELSDQVHRGKGINGTNVEFEIGVIITEASSKSKDGKANAGISVKVANLFNAEAGVGGGLSNESTEANQNTHNLKFKVFITEKP